MRDRKVLDIIFAGDEAEPDDRIELEAITVCCVCGRPINPMTESESEACDSLGVHVGTCFQALKRDLASMEARGPLPLPAAELVAVVTAQARRFAP